MWAATHRLHHQRSDQEGDPHSPLEGKWWSHMAWLFVNHSKEQRDILYHRYVPDLVDQPVMKFFERTYGLWLIAFGVALLAIGGIPALLWGMCVRMVVCVSQHVVRQFGNALVGLPQLRHARRIAQSVVGRPVGLWRRLAQQPPCSSEHGAAPAIDGGKST